jgi:hypothetical protein
MNFTILEDLLVIFHFSTKIGQNRPKIDQNRPKSAKNTVYYSPFHRIFWRDGENGKFLKFFKVFF